MNQSPFVSNLYLANEIVERAEWADGHCPICKQPVGDNHTLICPYTIFHRVSGRNDIPVIWLNIVYQIESLWSRADYEIASGGPHIIFRNILTRFGDQYFHTQTRNGVFYIRYEKVDNNYAYWLMETQKQELAVTFIIPSQNRKGAIWVGESW